MWIAGHDIDALDAATRDYLKKIRAMPPAAMPGVLAPRSQVWVTILLPLTFGLYCLRAACDGLRPDSLFETSWLECTGWALGVTFTFIGLAGLKRRLSRDYLGRFLFLDGTYYWEVGFHRIRIMSVSQVVLVQERVYSTNGRPTQRRLVLRTQNGSEAELPSVGRRTAAFARFFNTCIQLRQRRGISATNLPPQMLAFLDNPGGLAYVANQLAAQNTAGKLNVRLNWSEVMPIPDPVFKQAKKWQLGWPARCLRLGVVVFILAFAVAGPIRSFLDERYHYQAVIRSPADDPGPPQVYLAAFPNGCHVAEIKVIYDDRLYTVALSRAQQNHSPATLRDYLANADNQRHRAEAARLINKFYDEAIERVRLLAEMQSGDKPLLQGLLALLDNLKASSSPVVHLGFDPHWAVAMPGDNEEKLLTEYISHDDDIHNLWLQKGKAVLVDPAGAFTHKLVLRREGLILQRFQEALGKILSTDIIACQLGANSEDCEINVEYGISPAGKLRKYTMTTQTHFDDGLYGLRRNVTTMTTNTIGLLRDYEIDWRVQIRADKNSKPYELLVRSDPARYLTMSSNPGDPPWAPYAVTFYSAFYDFSGQLVASVGLPLPPAPTHFQFNEPRH